MAEWLSFACLFCLWHAVVVLCCCFFFFYFFFVGGALLTCCAALGEEGRRAVGSFHSSSPLPPSSVTLTLTPFLSFAHSLSLFASARMRLCLPSLPSLHRHTRSRQCCGVAGRSFDLWMGVCVRGKIRKEDQHTFLYQLLFSFFYLSFASLSFSLRLVEYLLLLFAPHSRCLQRAVPPKNDKEIPDT